MVDGERLGFYHFTGFDSGAHMKMLKKYANYNHAVKELVDWYISQIKLHTKSNSQEWGFSRFSNGELISDQQRDLYSQRIDLQMEFKNPFQESGFLRWYNSQLKTPLKFFIFALKKYALKNKNQKILRGPLYPNLQSSNYKKSE